MTRMTRVYSAAIVGISALSLAACGGSASPSSTTAAAQDSAAPTAAASGIAASEPADGPKTTAPAKAAGGAGGGAAVTGNTVTIAGPDGGTFQLGAGTCLGSKSPSGRLVLTSEVAGPRKFSAIVTFDGSGNMGLLLTAGEDSTAVVWAGDATVGATASRTEDTIKFVDLPIKQLTGVEGTASGALKCENRDGLI
ncbi:hypothetical protein [Kitasatospora sp. SUK 42]|uniref:hypothetical protein n=1 Tax=Kitasatospora sp. SUK 42 TaxID=1588882 RepID=UPI0018C90A39|nr:hypothetical protein [Kitasatospora sp. SUK 42]MBV2156723.1 hypothetical protein [Kitasatospora sp. SUK 42]